jgi:hypothetical protein
MTSAPVVTPVISIEAATAGDLVFFDSPGRVSWLIRLAQKLRWKGDKNHVGWLDHQQADGTWDIGQAEGKGVTISEPLVPTGMTVVRLPAVCNREAFLYFARSQIGRKYGFLTVASVFVTLLTPKFFDVMLPNTWICSAVVAEAMRFAGWYRTWPDIYQVAPDPLFAALVVST